MKSIVIALFIIFLTPGTFSSKSFSYSVHSFVNSQPKIAVDLVRKVKKPNKRLLQKRKIK